MAGPKFNQKIFNILLKFRVHRVAVIADIEKAFLMVSVAKKDREVLWVDDILADQPKITELHEICSSCIWSVVQSVLT